MPSVNFRLTVLGRMVLRDRKKLPETITEVLNEEDLQYQTRKKYEVDLRYLAKSFNYDVEELLPLLSVLESKKG